MHIPISVIIPVYNGASYVKKAISSALSQKEVKEVLVINDGSTDDTDLIINELAKEDDRVEILYHTDKKNKGRAASRNLGIKAASQVYIAFLDADDFYLENRFKNDLKIFKEIPEAEGVYNAIGVHFYRPSSDNEKRILELTTMSKYVASENLFVELLRGKLGSFSIDGLTLKKAALTKTGYFNERLAVMEDTAFIWKLALTSRLVPGNLVQPVAMRGVHGDNVFNNTEIYNSQELTFYESLFFWSVKEKLKLEIVERFLERVWIVKNRERRGMLYECFYWLKLILKSPRILFSKLHFRYSPFQKIKRFFKRLKK